MKRWRRSIASLASFDQRNGAVHDLRRDLLLQEQLAEPRDESVGQ
jgi:hypothetical protein